MQIQASKIFFFGLLFFSSNLFAENAKYLRDNLKEHGKWTVLGLVKDQKKIESLFVDKENSMLTNKHVGYIQFIRIDSNRILLKSYLVLSKDLKFPISIKATKKLPGTYRWTLALDYRSNTLVRKLYTLYSFGYGKRRHSHEIYYFNNGAERIFRSTLFYASGKIHSVYRGKMPFKGHKGPDYDLQNAAYKGNLAGVKLALGKGAKINKLNVNGGSALGSAIISGHVSVVRYLIKNGAIVRAVAKSGLGENLLLLNIRLNNKGSFKIARELLIHGVDVNARDKSLHTPLIRAAEIGSVEICRLLLKYKPNIDAQDNEGRTALIVAASLSRKKLMKLLISHGANQKIKDKSGETAADKLAEFEDFMKKAFP